MAKNNLLRFILVAAIVLAVAAFLLNWSTSKYPDVFTTQETDIARVPQHYCRDFSQASLKVAGTTFGVALAQTQQERSRGLSDCAYIPPNSGMYFSYDTPKIARFWMKDMLVPLDIIWVADGQVIGIEQNVPAPTPGTPDSGLPKYLSPKPITAVLEVPAGSSELHGITVGDTVDVLVF